MDRSGRREDQAREAVGSVAAFSALLQFVVCKQLIKWPHLNSKLVPGLVFICGTRVNGSM